jgi:hypothetical protein
VFAATLAAAQLTLTRGPLTESVSPRAATIAFVTSAPARAVVTLDDGTIEETPSERDHAVRLNGLTPGRTYSYRVGTIEGGKILARGSFRAAPNGPARFTFAVVGDFGSGSEAERRVAREIGSWHPDFVVTTGDNSYPLALPTLFDRNIFRPYAEVMRHTAWFMSLGNHDEVGDGGASELAAFHLPGAERWYHLRWGQVDITVLDSNLRMGSDTTQGRFAAQSLGQGSCFRFTAWHHPPWSPHSEGIAPRLRADIVPLLERNRVDVSLLGHVHSYERSVPRGGVTYVTAGTGGAEIGRYGDSTLTAARLVRDTYGALRVDVAGRSARFRFISDDGRTLDDFTRVCPQRG